MSEQTRWERRFTAPSILEFRWATEAPDRVAVVSNESGSSEAWAWDLTTGERRLASGEGVGAEEVYLTPDGEGVVWWLDPVGDERGRWMVTPFEGGEARPLFPSLEDGWMMGISFVPGVSALGLCFEEDYAVFVVPDGGEPREVFRSAHPAGVGQEWPQGPGGLSADGSLVCVRHAEHGDIAHQDLRVFDTSTGEVVGDLADEGCVVVAGGWSPMPGDGRLVVIRELDDWPRPWLWTPATGDLEELPLEGVPGVVTLGDWYPGGDALLLHQDHEARDTLWRLALADGSLTEVVPAEGSISQAAVRPDGEVWLRFESGVRPPEIRTSSGTPALELPGEPAPEGRPFEAVWFDGPGGQRIQGWLTRPDGEGPFPTVLSVHGGPDWHVPDYFDVGALAFADEGYAVLQVNYRGSTGYGRAFQEALQGNIGFPETEDVLAGLDHLVAQGVADPDRVFIEGWSWGGYIALLAAGLHPERCRGVIAGIPTGDYVAAHYECAPMVRDWDVAIMGGSPMELPELFRERNPMTYVNQVRAPVLIIAGENDSRCPLGQVMVYAHALRVRSHPVQVHLYAAGHHANDDDELIAHTRMSLEFMAAQL